MYVVQRALIHMCLVYPDSNAQRWLEMPGELKPLNLHRCGGAPDHGKCWVLRDSQLSGAERAPLRTNIFRLPLSYHPAVVSALKQMSVEPWLRLAYEVPEPLCQFAGNVHCV